MRRALAVLFILFLPALSNAQLTVEEARIYRDGATVIMKGVSVLHRGENMVGFIPSDIDRSTLQVATNCDSAYITGIDLKKANRTDIYKDKERELERLKTQEMLLEDKVSFYEKLIDSLAKAYQNSRRLNYLPYEKRFKELYNVKLSLKQKLNMVRTKIRKLEEKLKKLSTKLAIYLESSGEDECEITVGFQTKKARWKPSYILTYNNNRVTLELRAIVSQSTKDRWENVSVTLSSTPPTRFLYLPELSPWFVRSMERMFALKKSLPARAAPTATAPEIEARRGRLGFYYVIPNEITLEPGREKVVVLKRFSWDGVKIRRVCYPTKQDSVFASLVLSLPNFPMPPGSIKIFVENTYMGTTSTKEVVKGKRLVIPLGADEDLQVKSVADKRLEETWSGKNRLVITRKIEILNLKDKEVEVEVVEPLPVSKDEKVKVSIDRKNMNPEPEKIDENGLATWILKIPPGKEAKVTYTFAIEFPKKSVINLIY